VPAESKVAEVTSDSGLLNTTPPGPETTDQRLVKVAPLDRPDLTSTDCRSQRRSIYARNGEAIRELAPMRLPSRARKLRYRQFG
jgi:hypothetical protein